MTQLQIVINQLKSEGKITRNWCLQRYITRLAAIIAILKKQGWGFKAFDQAGDYVYQVTKRPGYTTPESGQKPPLSQTIPPKDNIAHLEQPALFNLRRIND